MMATSAHAVTYKLADHPDGVLSSPTVSYGLRLDQIGGSPEERTFSVQDLFLTWDGGVTASISGTVKNNSSDEIFDVSHTFSGVSSQAGGFVATGGVLTLTPQAGNTVGAPVAPINSAQNGSNLAFLLLDDGHRLDGDNSSFVGRGWLSGPGSANDWLVTATVVPVPAAVWLFGSGLAGLFALRRRKLAQAA